MSFYYFMTYSVQSHSYLMLLVFFLVCFFHKFWDMQSNFNNTFLVHNKFYTVLFLYLMKIIKTLKYEVVENLGFVQLHET